MSEEIPFLYFDYSDISVLLRVFFIILGLFIARYFLVSLLYNFVFLRGRSSDDKRLLVRKRPGRKQMKREIRWAMISSVIFAVITLLMIIGWQQGWIRIYTDWTDYPLWYIPISILLLLMFHEAYYYWLHRWMHRPGIYRLIHKGHHDSGQTSVFTAFSFHPWESLLQAVFLPLALIIIPVQLYVFIAILVFMTLSATVNHAGVEVYPSGRLGRCMGRWLVGSSHHHVHHTRFHYNYGLYFTFWDKLMKTENKEFENEYNRIIDSSAD
ncbi:MAG: sterol desaturase family protein [Cyclobacteriaceae bacterium]